MFQIYLFGTFSLVLKDYREKREFRTRFRTSFSAHYSFLHGFLATDKKCMGLERRPTKNKRPELNNQGVIQVKTPSSHQALGYSHGILVI